MRVVATAAALAAILSAWAWAGAPSKGPGPGWADPGAEGHADLVAFLSERHMVRALEGTMAILPAPEPGDVLLLFPSHRPSAPGERAAAAAFARQGGTVVVAGIEANAGPWLRALGLPDPDGLPVVLAGGEGECVETFLPDSPSPLCLPSPASMAAPATATFISNASQDLFLDLDGDGRLGLGDRGPVPLPMAFGLELGEGHVVVLADGDLWRNGVVRLHPDNLAAAGRLAEAASTVYLDSTGAQAGGLHPLYAERALASPGLQDAWALALAGALAGSFILLLPRAKAWAAHRPRPPGEDAAIEAAARKRLEPRTR